MGGGGSRTVVVVGVPILDLGDDLRERELAVGLQHRHEELLVRVAGLLRRRRAGARARAAREEAGGQRGEKPRWLGAFLARRTFGQEEEQPLSVCDFDV